MIDLDDLPWNNVTLTLAPDAFASGTVQTEHVYFVASSHGGALHISIASQSVWLRAVPSAFALAAGQSISIHLECDTRAAALGVEQGEPPVGTLQVTYEQLNSSGIRVSNNKDIVVRLPVAICPTCKRVIRTPNLGPGGRPPNVCPYCFERLLSCAQCGVLNTWKTRVCVANKQHIIRTSPDWVVLGGDGGHRGVADAPLGAGAMLWQFPSSLVTNPLRRLQWSSPITAFGIVFSGSTTGDGSHALHAFSAETGTLIWDAFPLPAPIHPERGGCCISDEFLIAGLVSGSVVALDAIRGTRRWIVDIGGTIYGSIIPTMPNMVAVVVADGVRSGRLVSLGTDDGRTLYEVPLSGRPDTAPAFSDGVVVVHDDSGGITAVDALSGRLVWTKSVATGFDAAPVIHNGVIYSAGADGIVRAIDLMSGVLTWESPALGGGISATPSLSETVLVVPTIEGICLVSRQNGQPVHRSGRGPVRAQPIVSPDGYYFAGKDARLHRLTAGLMVDDVYDAGGGGPQIAVSMAYADGRIFLATTRGVLYGLRMTGLL